MNELPDEVRKKTKKILDMLGVRLVGVLDNDDLLYLLAKHSLRQQGYTLVDSKVFQDKKIVGELESITLNDDRVNIDVKIRVHKPLHSIKVEVILDDISAEKEKNDGDE